MSELVPAEKDQVLALLKGKSSKYGTPEVKKDLGSDYLKILQLHNGSSTAVKTKQVDLGAFALRKKADDYVDLGEEVIFLLVSWRPKAMMFSGPLSYYNPDSKEYQEIKKSGGKGTGYGPELLIWLPEQKTFATFFLASPTARNEADNLLDPFDEGVVTFKLKSKLIDPPNSEHSWFGFTTLPYDLEVTMPPFQELEAEKNKFDNPPDFEGKVKEEVEEGTDVR